MGAFVTFNKFCGARNELAEKVVFQVLEIRQNAAQPRKNELILNTITVPGSRY